MKTGIINYIEDRIGERISVVPHGNGIVETESGKSYFLKRGNPSRAFSCEVKGLAELARGGVEVPEVILFGEDFILLQYIRNSTPTPTFYTRLGQMVAGMHRVTADKFGFYEDNYIGNNIQPNVAKGNEAVNWAEFYFDRRLNFQLSMAIENGYFRDMTASGLSRLEEAVYGLLSPVTEPPSLLHGDLWGGNYLCGRGDTPFLIDPAVYYGHRETDIAMTMLFGGFPQEFYMAYDQEYPLAEGWRKRMPLYQLYHILNHLNLFGSTYLRRAVDIMNTL
ncbi:MAG: fructosamine kinase family protein [Rikenellaceae bacterium]|nr:fructosamine kinase family protein [Rikenellaceae bacterium]